MWQAPESISSPFQGLVNSLLSPLASIYQPSLSVSPGQCSFIHRITTLLDELFTLVAADCLEADRSSEVRSLIDQTTAELHSLDHGTH